MLDLQGVEGLNNLGVDLDARCLLFVLIVPPPQMQSGNKKEGVAWVCLLASVSTTLDGWMAVLPCVVVHGLLALS